MNKSNVLPEPGARVRYLREKLGLSRQQFESTTGIKANTLRHLEKGTLPLSPTKARSLSIIFIYFFKLSEEEASEEFLLHGEQKESSK